VYSLVMLKDKFSARLKCPYCDEFRQSHEELKVHIGKQHKEKVDEFMEVYLGGRYIEVEFISLMLRKSMGKMTEESCIECGGCDVTCPISLIHKDFHPYDISLKLLEGKEREILRSNIIWACTKCYACGQNCTSVFPPFDVLEILMNLSNRIGYHVPKKYKEYDKSIFRSSIIQKPSTLKIEELTLLIRNNVELPKLPAHPDLPKFKEAMQKLSAMRN
jgi:heterodisulfide reductase subunit C